MQIEINPKLDAKALAKDFEGRNRLQIRDFFTAETAEYIHITLVQNTYWRWQFLENGKRRRILGNELNQLPIAERQETWRQIYTAAQTEHQYLHYCYPMMEEFEAGNDLDHDLFPVWEFLKSEEMISLIKGITGDKSLSGIDAEANWYQRDQFRSPEDEGQRGSGVAFELNFTRGWREDFGGYLRFHGENGNIEQGFKPRENSLTLFDASQPHSVGYVTPFSENYRVALSGRFTSA